MRIAGTSSVGGGRPPLFHSPDRLVVGPAPLAGVLDLMGTPRRPPLRLYFPAEAAATAAAAAATPRPAGYFVNGRVAYYLQGFAHIGLARHTTRLHRWVLRPLLWLLSLAFPARYLTIPGTAHVRNKDDAASVKYAPLSSLALKEIGAKENGEGRAGERTQRLVVFSHGLTGTGEENSVYCAALAKRGHVVAAIHHRDGSSCRVPLPDGSCRYYQHLPRGDDYDPHHRLEQLHARSKEFLDTCSWLMGEDKSDENSPSDDDDQHPIVDEIRKHLDERNVIAAGFSYGAATASLAATLDPARFRCAILLDGWFHVDFSSRGIEFDMPPESFGNVWPQSTTSTDSNGAENSGRAGKGLDVPSLFINSSQFQGYEKLYGATRRLADQINSGSNAKDNNQQQQKAELHVIPETTHQNFCDTIFWMPRRLGRKLFQLGDADAYGAYEDILNWTVRFLERF